jgi:hypothetical protein
MTRGVKSSEVAEQANTEEKIVRTAADRPQRKERIPFGVPRSKLAVNVVIPGKHLHWINDSAGRIFEAEQGGYEFVTPQEIGSSDRETQVRKLVGRNEDGSPLYAYLMKIDQEWYEEDQQIIQNQLDDIDAAMKQGRFEEKPGDRRYVPTSGISIKN